MEDAKAKIDRITSEHVDFKFGDYISRGFAIFQKDMGGFIGYTFVFFLVTIVISMIPVVGGIANSLVVTPAMTAGIYLVARKLDSGERTEFGDFFKGFDFTAQLALAALVTALFIVISLIPFGVACWDSGIVEWYQAVLENPGTPPTDLPDLPPWWSVFLLLPALFLSIAYGWTYLFIIFYHMDFWQAMEASRKLLTRLWPIYFLFVVVIGLIAVAGIFLLCIGLLATFPAMLCMTYVAFANVTRLHVAHDAGEDIEQHLIS